MLSYFFVLTLTIKKVLFNCIHIQDINPCKNSETLTKEKARNSHLTEVKFDNALLFAILIVDKK